MPSSGHCMVRFLLPLACLAACSVAGGAWALGLGAVQAPPVLGQALDLTLPITLADGETLDADCIDAELHVGDARVPADRLALGLRPGGRPGEVLLRLRSGIAATEPVVTLSVIAGCPARVTRRYTLLAELPGLTATAPVAAATPVVQTAAGGETPDARPAAAARYATALPAPNASPRAAPRPTQPATRAGAAPPPLGDVAPMPPEPSDPRSRRVDALPLAVEQPAATSDITVPGVGTQPVAADAAPARGASTADRTTPAAPRAQAGTSDGTGAAAMLLLAALAAGGGAAGALALRRRRGAAAAKAPYATPPLDAAVPASAVPAAPALVAPRSVPAPSAPIVERAAAVSRPAPEAVVADTALATLHAGGAEESADAMPLLDLSLDEQIDLEQQVDFFVVLGRDDAAVEALHEHLRRSGGRMPLAWLKLLEIQRRGGDRGLYEATARRFGEACGVVAPGWDAMEPRRGLDDDAPRLEALQRCWSRPSDAMAWLDALLHHRHEPRGPIGLATYEDALLLYRIARDLHDHGAGDSGPVDLLLPHDVETSREPGRPPASPRRDGAPATRVLGGALPFELDFDRVAATGEREALFVR